MCKVCHFEACESWPHMEMAGASDVLTPSDGADMTTAAGLDPGTGCKTDDECARSQVTGYGKKGGFTSIEATPGWVRVGREVCHGAGGSYTRVAHTSLQNRN